MENTHRNIKTVMLILIWVSMGLYMEVGGPTLMDLKLHFDTDYESVARAISALGLGVLLGSLIAGLIVDAMGKWKDLIITFAQLLTAVATTSMPYVGNVSVLWFLFFVNGIASGAVNVAGQRILLEMWKEKAASPMHALHMGFGIGALITPLITNNFLAVLRFGNAPGDFDSLNITANQSHGVADNGIPFIIVEETLVPYAFVTIGLIVACLSIPFLIYPFYVCRCYTEQDDVQENVNTDSSCSKLMTLLNPATYTSGSLTFGIQMFFIIFAFYMNSVGAEQMYGNFVRTFSIDQLNFQREEASYLDTAYWGSFTIGRLLGSLLSHCIPIRTLFVIDVMLNLLAVTLLDIFSTNNHFTLWAFTVLVGFMVAPLFPAFISFLNSYMEVGGIVLTLVMLASGSGHFFYVWLAGFLYDKHGPKTVLYALQLSSILVVIISAIVMALTYRRKDRFKTILTDANYTSGSLQEISYSTLNEEDD